VRHCDSPSRKRTSRTLLMPNRAAAKPDIELRRFDVSARPPVSEVSEESRLAREARHRSTGPRAAEPHRQASPFLRSALRILIRPSMLPARPAKRRTVR
jgi:hypothetical protein